MTKMSYWLVATCLLSCLILQHVGAAEDRTQTETYKLIYDDLKSFSSCYRRFNGTHEIGCTSGLNGNAGVIHYINDSASLTWLIEKGPHKPYIPLLESEMFTGSNMEKLNRSEKIEGVMVIWTSTSDRSSYPSHYSPDTKCPNELSSIYTDGKYSCDKHQYNPKGNGLMFEDLKMPVVLLTSQEEVDRAIKCYLTHNLPPTPNNTDSMPVLPLCSAELHAFMNGAGNTEICMRRNTIFRNFDPDQYCQILGGYSPLAFLKGTPKDTPRAKVIVITARLDTFSLFENIDPGTSSPVSALTVLLTAAETLSHNVAVRHGILEAGYNVLFIAFAGESFDYIGSQKLVYDMQRGFFPNSSYDEARMKMSDIDIFVELSQLIDAFAKKTLYTHVDPNTYNTHSTVINKFVDALKSEAVTVTVEDSSGDLPLPPTSAQMFLRENDDGLPVVVLADYDDKFLTNYYNAYLDTPEVHDFYLNRSAADYDTVTPQAIFLADVATTVSRAVYKYATGDSEQINSLNSTANQLLYCFLITRQCDLFYGTIGPNHTDILDSSSSPLPLYVSIYSPTSIVQHMQLVVKQLLAYYTGSEIDEKNWEQCTKDEDGIYISGVTVNGTRTPMCLQSTAQYHNASSPAFEIENYNFSTAKYSTWTESVWGLSAFRLRIFLKPSSEVELASMVAGITIFIVTAIIVVLLHKRAAVLFPPHLDSPLLQSDRPT